MSAIQDAVARERRRPRCVPRIVAGSLFAPRSSSSPRSPPGRSTGPGRCCCWSSVASPSPRLIAALAWRRRWGGWLIGRRRCRRVPRARRSRSPCRRGSAAPPSCCAGSASSPAGAVLAWKDLVTVELPVGSYRNLLVPALVVFLVGTCALLLLSWREDRLAYAAVPVAIGMTSLRPVLRPHHRERTARDRSGRSCTRPSRRRSGSRRCSRACCGSSWRTHDERVRALQRAAASSGVRVSRRAVARRPSTACPRRRA